VGLTSSTQCLIIVFNLTNEYLTDNIMEKRKTYTIQRPYLTAKEVEEVYGFSQSRLAVWRRDGSGFPFHRFSHRHYGYYPAEIEAWMESKKTLKSVPRKKKSLEVHRRKIANAVNDMCDGGFPSECVDCLKRLQEELMEF
jgi:predicted DNA-binding transcriptional regulator AlpA